MYTGLQVWCLGALTAFNIMLLAELNYFICFQFPAINWNVNIPLLKKM